MSNFRAQGFAADDDNGPAPENIPSPQDQGMDSMYLSWGSEPLDPRRTSGVRDLKPTMVGADPSLHTILGYFLRILPINFFKTTVIVATNETLSDPLSWEEFLRFMGILFLLATTQGIPRQMFWASDSPDIFSDAPFRLHAYMSRRHFESILKNLKFTTKECPSFKHPFHPVSNLIAAYNQHTHTIF
jgi:hypothetical protein